MEYTPVGKVCSFCGVVGTADHTFAGGLGALMCSECLDKYHQIFHEPPTRDSLRRPPWDVMSDQEVLETIPKITAVAAQVDDFMREWIKVVRSRGLSWADIGRVMGTSRQAAWQRFHAYVDGDAPFSRPAPPA